MAIFPWKGFNITQLFLPFEQTLEFGREATKGICPGIPTKAHLKLVELQAFGKK